MPVAEHVLTSLQGCRGLRRPRRSRSTFVSTLCRRVRIVQENITCVFFTFSFFSLASLKMSRRRNRTNSLVGEKLEEVEEEVEKVKKKRNEKIKEQ